MPSFNSIRIDTEKCEKGDWHDFTLIPGISLKIARLHNKGWTQALQEAVLLDPSNAEKARDMSSEFSARLVCDHILLDWKGVEDDNDKKVKFTPKKAFEYVSNPELKQLLQFIMVIAGNDNNFRKLSEAQAVKN